MSRTRPRPKTTSRAISRLSRLPPRSCPRTALVPVPCRAPRVPPPGSTVPPHRTAAGMRCGPVPRAGAAQREEEQGGLVGEVQDRTGDDPEHHGERHADADGHAGERRHRHAARCGLDSASGGGIGQHLDAGRPRSPAAAGAGAAGGMARPACGRRRRRRCPAAWSGSVAESPTTPTGREHGDGQPEVEEGGHRTGHHGHDGQRVALVGHRGLDHTQLGQEPGGERRTGLAEQQHGEGQGQQGLAFGQPPVVGDRGPVSPRRPSP